MSCRRALVSALSAAAYRQICCLPVGRIHLAGIPRDRIPTLAYTLQSSPPMTLACMGNPRASGIPASAGTLHNPEKEIFRAL